jgi:SpoVK/Ycf46/Vps4 family AAA+-type ATPase
MPLDNAKPSSYVPLKPMPPKERQDADTGHGKAERDAEASRDDMFQPETSTRCIDDLVISEEVRSRLNSVINRIRNHKKLYEDWGLADIDPHGKRVAINLYGPPGTGKTSCADAIANFMGKQIIRVNYAEIESKYVGDTPKNIAAAFRKARDSDSVLFFDEADSILGRRLTNVTQSADHGVNVSRSVMLLQLDQFAGVVLFATNLASNYDSAFVRRIMAHIEFPLPDNVSRIKLWQLHLPKRLPLANDIAHDALATESDGLSGGDIKNVVVNAASIAVERSGTEQMVSMADLLTEIGHIKTAKSSIGEQSSRVRFSESEQRIEDAPADVQERLREIKRSRRQRSPVVKRAN